MDKDLINGPKKPSAVYVKANSIYKIIFGSFSLGLLYVVLAGLVGFYGGIGAQVFNFFYHLTGA